MRGPGKVELNKIQIAISVRRSKAPEKECNTYHNFLRERTQMNIFFRAAEGLAHGGACQQHSGL
jgi:hypothetical protein